MTSREESGQVLQEGRMRRDLEPQEAQARPLKVGTAEMGGSEGRVVGGRENIPEQKEDKESSPRPTPHLGPFRLHSGRPGAQPCRPPEAASKISSPSD